MFQSNLSKSTLLSLLLSAAFVSVGVAQNSPHGDIKIPCGSCHTTDSWKMRSNADFDHARTGFPLEDSHNSVACAGCHADLRFTGANSRCTSCHTDVHKAELGTNCIRCHTTRTWKIADMIQKHQSTRFPLTGKHATLACQDCHTGASHTQYVGTATTCIGCHRNDFTSSTNPNHVSAGFSTNCVACHSASAFAWNASFDHNSQTPFPLEGAHKSVPCGSCHDNKDFKSTPTDCYPCHKTLFASTTDPNHIAGGFSTNCRTCHTTTVWRPSTFTHANTKFPLTGAHGAVACKDCHTNNQYATLSTDCAACHQSDFASTSNPNHQAGGFPQNCTMCHSTVTWQTSTFDHTTTKFPLTGLHRTVQCQACHANNNFQIAYSTCNQCHSTDFAATTNPNHRASGFSTNCAQCHSTTSWSGATFDHSTTKFALTGKHATLACELCHTNNNFTLAYTSCSQCHANDFAGATNPNHVAGNFSQNCQTCHSTTAWQPATFDHNTTKFALTGAHLATPCQSCHTNGNYQLVYSNCYQCHSSDFTGATNPNHVSGKFSQTCQTCHSTTAWQPATFDHSTTKFALTGAHVATPCASCHTNGNFQLSYTGCYSCHTTDYTGTTNPVHSSAGFPTTCETCHTTTSWSGATFNHTWFPTNHGNANGVCATCHTNASNYSVFTCTTCHTQAQTDPHHSGVRNYVYNSSNCYSCHPNGRS